MPRHGPADQVRRSRR